MWLNNVSGNEGFHALKSKSARLSGSTSGVVKKRKLRYETMNISIDKKLSNYEPSWNYKEKGSAERIELDR